MIKYAHFLNSYPSCKMKKSHSNQHISLDNTGFSDTFADHPLVQWISENGRLLMWILGALIILVFFLYRTLGASSSNAEGDYLYAEKEFIIFQNSVNSKEDTKTRQAALDNLTAVLKKHPEIQAKYDGPIAQALINVGDIKEATVFADRTLARTSIENLPLYTDYAKTTLNISNHHYEEAFKQALNLKQQMLDAAAPAVNKADQKAFGDFLYAFNLLRIAMLSQQIGDKGHELAAWQELQSLNPKTESLEAIKQVFQEGKTSLQDYIQTREKTLK